jgi:hypothetical protein
VACPYFYPLAEADFEARAKPARAPLGTIFAGECHVWPDAPFRPSDLLLYEQCNFGYGRGSCPSFPAAANADAVRFTDWKGTLLYVLERDYSPVAHGVCDAGMPAPEIAQQAAMFARTCLNKPNS